MRTYDIERYLNIRSAYGASFSADGERLSFLMDTTGVPQVWTVDSPGAPVALVFGAVKRFLKISHPALSSLGFVTLSWRYALSRLLSLLSAY